MHYLKNLGIKTANFFTAIPDQFKSKKDLPISFPLFLKPIDAANGNGIDDLSYVTNFIEFENKVASLFEEFKLPVLVEEYLDGKEYTVSVIQSSTGKLIVSPIEIEPLKSTNGLRILGQKAKIDDSEELKSVQDIAIRTKLIKLATDSFYGLGARDYGRIDIKTNRNGECYFMEANLVPGMSKDSSYFPKACEIANNLSYDEVVAFMLEKGINRILNILQSNINSDILIKEGA